MNIVFVSDIHGCHARLIPVLDFFERIEGDKILCIGGDIINYGPRNGLPAEGLDPQAIVESLNKISSSIVAVRGNCDSEVDQMLLRFPISSDFAVVTDGSRRFFITHGHKLLDDDKLPWLSTDVIVSGHTHMWNLSRDAQGVVHLNTGSVTFPKGGNPPTFAHYDGSRLNVLNLFTGEVLASELL